MNKNKIRTAALCAVFAVILLPIAGRADVGEVKQPAVKPTPVPITQPVIAIGEEPANEAPWSLSVSPGRHDYEGDEAVVDGFLQTISLSYDFNEWWTIEGSFLLAPNLDEDFRFDIPTEQRVSRLEETAGAGAHSTWAAGLAVDGLFHFTRWERVDPYLTLGAGFLYYDEQISDSHFEPTMRAGYGIMYHFNDEWAVRGDFRALIAGENTEANSTLSAGVVWTIGANVPPKFIAKGPLDSDADGLLDAEETDTYRTDPFDPDSDNDELTDGEEVKTYHTDPNNPDSDYDMLRDGQEVLKYSTKPLEADTDKGGVSDGHEVLEDRTDPLNGKDDLILFRLHIEFDTDKWDVKPEYFKDIDVIGKTLSRDSEATAKIEGHADKRRNSGKGYNQRLSEKRAKSVLEYLADKHGIDRARMKSVGCGFSQPIAPNDPETGNPQNRRVDVYIDSPKKRAGIDITSEKGADQPATAVTAVAPAAPAVEQVK